MFQLTVLETRQLLPLSIQQELENGRIKDDDTLVLVGFGGGLTWGAMVIKWGK